ncbi:MAG TPA: RNA polymerase Rpb4 [Thermoprotei archaeon]|nr:RNA polymerase Rpb4 [Thermoprotei archaeon]
MSEEVGRKILGKEPISIPELKEILDSLDIPDEELPPITIKVKEYINKFSKITPEKAKSLKRKLMELDGVDEEKAVQIINILPRSTEEIKEIFYEKVILGDLPDKILNILKEEKVI